ncbi:replication initiator protein A [Streptococcus uberis]|uniref:replication initiator protein A n=1 Tax=Streptococcus uberis TaxID=1349 RepID=UPI003D76BCC4
MDIHEVINNKFYQFPQWLLKEPYNNLSDKAKIMYMLLFDRRSLSEQNKWYDKNGKIYLYFTIEQFMEALKCSRQTVIKSKKELSDIGLIIEERQGINKPNRIYINGSLENRLQEVQKLDAGSLENRLQEVQKLDSINTNNINTNISINNNDNRGLGQTLKRLNYLDDYQVTQILEYVGLDNMEIEVIQEAIKRCTDQNKRSFAYLNAILKNWKLAGIKTMDQVQEEQRKFGNYKNNGRSINQSFHDNFPVLPF